MVRAGKIPGERVRLFCCKSKCYKANHRNRFVGVNSGFNHLIRPMFYEAYHRIENISNPNGPERIYTVVGNICETDTFAWDRKINEVREGDYLVFYNAGAYGFEMSSNFNSRLKPAEVLIKNGEVNLIRRRDEFEDLLKTRSKFYNQKIFCYRLLPFMASAVASHLCCLTGCSK